MKAGTHNHVKVKRLKRLLGIPLYRAVGILETLWLLCTDCCDEGNIGKFTDEEIADYLEWDGSASELVRCLTDSQWIDADEEHRLMVHDWLDHCPEFIKDRLRKRGARSENDEKRRKIKTYVSSKPDNGGQNRTDTGRARSCPVYVNSIQGNSGQSNSIQEPSSADADGVPANPSDCDPLAAASGSEDKPAPDSAPNGESSDETPKPSRSVYAATFERWYKHYPRKVGKQEAAASFGRALKRIVATRKLSNAEALDWLCDLTQRFASSPAGRAGTYTPHPATWLNNGRYDDDPQEWNREHSGKQSTAPGPGQVYTEGHEITGFD